jgi:uncharacterized membrane protein YuzA (DUF378 family)
MSWYEKTALVLAAIGAINWGLVGINVKANLVNLLLGRVPAIERIVYLIVGLCGIYAIIKAFK